MGSAILENRKGKPIVFIIKKKRTVLLLAYYFLL